MVRVAVCDDESYMLSEITCRVKRYMGERKLPCQVSCFRRGEELLRGPVDYDLVFLDIRMEGLGGMETARKLRDRSFSGPLIFVTVLGEYVYDSFEVEAFDYLLKPFDDGRFEHTLERALGRIRSGRGRELTVRRGGECRILPIADIVFCEAINRKIYLHLKNGEIVDYYFRIGDLEKELSGDFFRCHRSYLINLTEVRSIKDGSARMSRGEEIPVSRLRERELSEVILRYMREKGGGG